LKHIIIIIIYSDLDVRVISVADTIFTPCMLLIYQYINTIAE